MYKANDVKIGRPYTYCNGTSNYLYTSSYSTPVQLFTCISLLSYNGLANGPIWSTNVSSRSDTFYPLFSDGTYQIPYFTPNTSPITVGTYVIVVYVFGVSQIRFHIYTPSSILLNISVPRPTDAIFYSYGFFLGHITYNDIKAKIYELMYYNKELSSAEINDKTTYLVDKWKVF